MNFNLEKLVQDALARLRATLNRSVAQHLRAIRSKKQ
jgi:hypothetical protein